MDVSGIIFAAIDCDADAVEEWNRWYDLEHLPPNVALPGIMSGRRYVSPPHLMAARLPAEPMAGFGAGQGAHITIYTIAGDPAAVIATMATYRDELARKGRMFAAERKAVRAGDAMLWSWCVADRALRADDCDVPHLAHSAVRVVLRRGGDDAARDIVAPVAAAVEGVHAVLGHAAVFQAGLDCDLYLLEGDPVEVVDDLRSAAPYGPGTEVVLDAPFQMIVPFDYSFGATIRASDMPRTVS